MNSPSPGPTASVSVVIPCYNQARYLPEAIESAIQQAADPPEVIVVDDGSTEEVGGAAGSYHGVLLLRQPNLGVASARNAGLARSTRDHVVFLDADDRLVPGGLQIGIEVLENHPGAACAAGLCRVIDACGSQQPVRQQPPVSEDPYTALLRGNFVWMPAQAIFRRRALVSEGGFDPSVSPAADYDLYLRLARRSLLIPHRHIVAEYRQHGQNMSLNALVMLKSTLAALERQWPYVRVRPEYRAAYAEGNRFWRHFYGDRVVQEIRVRLRSEGLAMGTLRPALSLLRYDPRTVALHLLRKLRNTVAGRVAAGKPV